MNSITLFAISLRIEILFTVPSHTIPKLNKINPVILLKMYLDTEPDTPKDSKDNKK